MMQKKVIIIGAGISGLSAGYYAKKSGLEVEIIEKNLFVGGLCTSWKRGVYTFDGGSSLMVDLSKLSLTFKQPFTYPEEVSAVFYDQNSVFHTYCDPERLKKEMLQISPEDSETINSWIEDLKFISRLDIPVDFSLRHLLSYYTFFKLMKIYKVPPWKYALKFKNKTLADVFSKALNQHDQCLLFSMLTLLSLNKKNAGYPVGGANSIITVLEKKFYDLGGTIRFNSSVSSILVQKNKARGVILTSGEELAADGVITCADGYKSLFEWLDKKYLTVRLKETYKKLETYPPLLTVNLGIKADYSFLPKRFVLSYPMGITIDITKIDQLIVENYSDDLTLTPGDKSVFQLNIPTNFRIWQHWIENPEEYQAKKKQILENCIFALRQKFPDLPNQIEETDTATPITYYRYTGNWQGSYQGFMIKEKKKFYPISQNLPLLRHFYMAGHWTKVGGGITTSINSARSAVRKLCKELRQPFTS